eukprot:1157210-Pelagomonas_calceolata.AAC.7
MQQSNLDHGVDSAQEYRNHHKALSNCKCVYFVSGNRARVQAGHLPYAGSKGTKCSCKTNKQGWVQCACFHALEQAQGVDLPVSGPQVQGHTHWPCNHVVIFTHQKMLTSLLVDHHV